MLDKIKEYSALLTMVAVFIGGWLGHSMYADSTAKDLEMYREEIANANAQAIAQLKVENTTVQGKIIERVRTEIVYTECKHSDSDYKLITENW